MVAAADARGVIDQGNNGAEVAEVAVEYDPGTAMSASDANSSHVALPSPAAPAAPAADSPAAAPPGLV